MMSWRPARSRGKRFQQRCIHQRHTVQAASFAAKPTTTTPAKIRVVSSARSQAPEENLFLVQCERTIFRLLRNAVALMQGVTPAHHLWGPRAAGREAAHPIIAFVSGVKLEDPPCVGQCIGVERRSSSGVCAGAGVRTGRRFVCSRFAHPHTSCGPRETLRAFDVFCVQGTSASSSVRASTSWIAPAPLRAKTTTPSAGSSSRSRGFWRCWQRARWVCSSTTSLCTARATSTTKTSRTTCGRKSTKRWRRRTAAAQTAVLVLRARERDSSSCRPISSSSPAASSSGCRPRRLRGISDTSRSQSASASSGALQAACAA